MTLRSIFGEGGFSDSEIDKLVYSRDAGDLEGEALAVVWPKDVKQLHALVGYAKRQEYNLVIRGAGTSLQGGCVPVKSIVVDMSKMNKVLEVGDDFIVVQAGAVLDELNHRLGDKIIPIKPFNHAVCTIGGMVAMNCRGMDVSKGRMGDYVLGVDVVDGTGKYMKLKNPTAKNFIGLEGTTGIIAHVKLKLVSKREHRSFSIYSFNTLSSMMEKVEKFRGREEVKSILFFDDLASSMLGFEEKNHIVVEFLGDKGVIKDVKEMEGILDFKEVLYHKLRKARYSQIEDPKIKPDKMAGFLYWLRKKGVPVYGHLCLGIVHPCFKEFSKLPTEMNELVETIKCENASDFGYGFKRKKFLKGEKKVKHKILKEQYDPKDILNRGKVHE